MSQYSLATCDPIQKRQEDRVNVRRAPQITGSVSTVLFETGTMNTFVATFDGADAGWETYASLREGTEKCRTQPRCLRSCSGASESGPSTPTKDTFAMPEAVFGGPINDSPSVSRAGTFEESVALLLGDQADSSSTPDEDFVPQRAKKRPSPLCTQAVDAAEIAPPRAPAPTPTSPSALRRVFGVLAILFLLSPLPNPTPEPRRAMKPMSIDPQLHELLSMGGGSIDDPSAPPIQTKLSPSASPLIGRGTALRSPLNPTDVTETSMNVCLVMILATYQLLVSYYVHPYEEALFVRLVLFITQPFADRLHDVLFLIAFWLICLAAAAIHSFFVGVVVSCVRSELERLSPPFGYGRRRWDRDTAMDSTITSLSIVLGSMAKILRVPVRPVVLATVRLVAAEALKIGGARLGAMGVHVALIGTLGIIVSFLYW
ncbi:hypothetical protein FKP32DRAFT_1670567 [Trametes sanguinea]|nr:hypothetical protein FKP32DRAFT_1670567 [Trametes sanguinea]